MSWWRDGMFHNADHHLTDDASRRRRHGYRPWTDSAHECLGRRRRIGRRRKWKWFEAPDRCIRASPDDIENAVVRNQLHQSGDTAARRQPDGVSDRYGPPSLVVHRYLDRIESPDEHFADSSHVEARCEYEQKR